MDNREADDEDEDDDDGDDDDDDHLFEFDLCDGEEEEEKSGGEDDDTEKHQLSDAANQSADSSLLPQLLPTRKFSISSDGSASSCQHRKSLDDATAEEARPAGFIGSLFGSRSSGICSERRSSQVSRV